MIQTYQGYFQEDGRFIADNMIVRIPPHRRVILNIMEDKIIMQNETDKKEIEERRAMIKSLKGCMTGLFGSCCFCRGGHWPSAKSNPILAVCHGRAMRAPTIAPTSF